MTYSKLSEEELWTKWRESYGGDGPRLVMDGIGDQDAFDKAPYKLLFVLREPNGWEGADMRGQLQSGVAYAVWYRVAEWAVGLLHRFPLMDKIERAERNEALRSIAAINIKKLPGGSRSNEGEIDSAAFRDREFLKRQIRLIGPHVIVCCGTYRPLRWVLSDDVTGEKTDPIRHSQLKNNSLIIEWRHPSRASRLKTYEDLRQGCECFLGSNQIKLQ